jgi:hypothetical protein
MRPLARRAAVFAIIVGGSAWFWLREAPYEGSAESPGATSAAAPTGLAPSASSVDAAAEAFRDRADGRVIEVRGEVTRTLADDRDGSRHQRFLIRSSSGVSLLIAHNIDLAPRLEGLASGESVTVRGEYVWNDKGGLMHWTHHDPHDRHQPGYIEWRGRRYQ